jgi:hypothetical protein
MSRRGLQIVLAIIGTAASAFGTLGVARGAGGVLKGGDVSPNVDSELRFFAAWYTVLGVLLLRAVRRPEAEATVVRACGAGFLLAACGRILSMRAVGSPSRFFRLLLGLELVLPIVVVPWQRRVERTATAR